MDQSELKENGGSRKELTEIITAQRMKKGTDTGYSDQDIIPMIRTPNGSFMDFLRRESREDRKSGRPKVRI